MGGQVTPVEILAQQRNDALARAADAEVRHHMAAHAAEAAFRALHECILSGQVPQDKAPALIARVPGFAEWRAAQKERNAQ